jgi:hypothetical protein
MQPAGWPVTRKQENPMARRSALVFAAVGAAVVFSGIGLSAGTSAEPLVVGEALTGINAPGVNGVIWTRRKDHFTLQIQLTTPPGARGLRLEPVAPGAAASPAGNTYPDVRVQLRDANGAQIPYLRRLAVSPGLQAQSVLRGATDGARRSEVIYTFHLGDGENADTITLQINEREFNAKVPRLGGTG